MSAENKLSSILLLQLNLPPPCECRRFLNARELLFPRALLNTAVCVSDFQASRDKRNIHEITLKPTSQKLYLPLPVIYTFSFYFYQLERTLVLLEVFHPRQGKPAG